MEFLQTMLLQWVMDEGDSTPATGAWADQADVPPEIAKKSWPQNLNVT